MIYLQLFLCFVQVGLFSIGGGYAAIPFIRELAVEKYGWMSFEEFAKLVTIAEMTPGPIAINAATFVGTNVAGKLGALAATAGSIFPSCVIVSIIAILYGRYKGKKEWQTVLTILRTVVVALIASAGLTILVESVVNQESSAAWMNRIDWIGLLLCGTAFLMLKKKCNPIIMMLSCGLLYMGVMVVKNYI